VRAAKLVDNRCRRITTHADGTDQVSETGFLHHMLRSCRPHNLHDLVLAKLDQPLVIVMKVEGDLGHRQSMLVLLIR
jgi:benzoyl-CoA reductase/2-hydroxyglutaryl-CoA dehydratase subunit BcrC/BadD/HgdB